MEIKIIRFAVYDKDQKERELISSNIMTFCVEMNRQAEVEQFDDTENLIEAFRQSSYSAVFIAMDCMDEVDTAWIIRKLAPKCSLVIMSNSGDYSMEGYRLEAFDYWLKPTGEAKTNQTLSRIAKLLTVEDYILTTQGDGSPVRKQKGGENTMDQLSEFIKKAKSDEELAEKVNNLCAKGAEVDEIVDLAAEYGFKITDDEIDKLEETKNQRELSEEQLERVAGGFGEFSGTKCWFTPTGKTKDVPTKDYVVTWAECNSTCVGFLVDCSCHKTKARGEEVCVGRWHQLDSYLNYLWPHEEFNHSKKAPPSYNT